MSRDKFETRAGDIREQSVTNNPSEVREQIARSGGDALRWAAQQNAGVQARLETPREGDS